MDITYPTGNQIKYLYDSENRISRIQSPAGDRTYGQDFSYHASGGLESYRTGDGTLHEISAASIAALNT